MNRLLTSCFLTFSLLLTMILPVATVDGQTKKRLKSPPASAADGAKPKPSSSKSVVDKPTRLRLPKQTWDDEDEENDPDMPAFMRGRMSKGDYLLRRGLDLGQLRGFKNGKPVDVRDRVRAIEELEKQESERLTSDKFNPSLKDALLAAWVSRGPAPIPNGQTTSTVSSVSGRVTAIDVNAANPDVAYVGTAQGGLYRTTDGGLNWTPLMDTAASVAIGAVTINPINPSQVFVGTGESNRSADSYAGVGLYRIDNADGPSPTLNGPFATRVAGTGTAVSTGIAFSNTSITKIVVDPADQNRIFVGNTTGVYGLGGLVNGTGGVNGFVGLWFSENAQAATINFSRVNGLPGGGSSAVADIVFEPGSSNNLLVATIDLGAAPDDSGIYRSTDASTASVGGNVSPTFTRTQTLTTTQASGSVLAINKVGATVTAFAAYQGSTNGTVVKSTDGGATWSAAIASASGFCGGQCFYDTAIAIDPADSSFVYVAGSATGASSRIFARSTDGGVTFAANENGLHADSHAIGIAPSNPSIVYTGNDGGIFRTANVKAVGTIAWSSRNTAQFLATQFMSLDTHPTDSNFMIGGTQDNGTNFLQPGGTWTRADFGDGGYAVIDQNAPDTTNVRMYHTYFNQTNAMGYGRVTSVASATDGNWTFFGCGFAGTPNGMTCAATAIRFYAPMERGPGNPNTLYFGSDVLYRSSDGGATMTKVSQDPITFGVPISAIGVAPTDDNVRLVGLSNGGLFGTTTGVTPLVDFDAGNVVPTAFISRVAIDPTNPNTAYVTLSRFLAGAQNVWKTTTLNAFANTGLAPTWTQASNGLPGVPVNAIVVDPAQPNNVYVGTDIGVYASTDGGANWTVFGTGLPRVAVFDMAIAPGSPRQLRIATHGKGIYDIPLSVPTAANVEISGRVKTSNGAGIVRARVTITGANGENRTVVTNSFGNYRIQNVLAGETYVISVNGKGYTFTPQTISVSDAVRDFDFTASN